MRGSSGACGGKRSGRIRLRGGSAAGRDAKGGSMSVFKLAAAALLLTLPAAAGTSAPRTTYTRTVAIVLYDGVEILDFAGPSEVFKAAAGFGRSGITPAFRVYTVAASREPLLSQG